MFSLTPGSTPADTTAVFALIALIADPAAAQKRLDELAAEKADALEVFKQAQDAAAELEAKRVAIAADLAEATKIRDENSATFTANAKSMADQQAALAEAKDAADAHEADLAKREAAIANRETELKAREDQVFTREVECRKTSDAAQALKSEYEQKVAALQAALR